MDKQELQQRYENGKIFAYTGGNEALKWYRSHELSIEWKADTSPVSLADRSAEELISCAIRASYPNDAILGEEYGHQSGSSGWQWIIDPIDGTQSFIHGVPLWGTLLALRYEQELQAGWVYLPALAEFLCACPTLEPTCSYYASIKDQQELLHPGIATEVSQTKDLRNALWCHTSPDYFADADMLWLHDLLQQRCRFTRAWSDCYSFVLLATGRVDLVVEPVLKLWDVAPFDPIIRAAKGQIGDFTGTTSVENGSIVAANPTLFQQTIALISET